MSKLIALANNIYRVVIASLAITIIVALQGCMGSQKAAIRRLDNAKASKPFDAIIVPGIPFKNGGWDSVMKARVLWSYILYKNGYAKNIIFSGGAVYSGYCESIIMGLYAQQLGVPKEHIIAEKQARHSTENVYYSYLLAKEQGFKSLAVATDPFQSASLRYFANKRFLSPVVSLPFVIDSLRAYNYLHPIIDPTPAYQPDFVNIEREPKLKRLRGTMGRDINWRQYPRRKVPEL